MVHIQVNMFVCMKSSKKEKNLPIVKSYCNEVSLLINMLNKKTLGVKNVQGQSEAALQTGATKNFDIS